MANELSPAIADGLVAYLAARDQYHADEIRRRWDALSVRERRLVREAAVMGYVQGVLSQPGGSRAAIPHDSDIVSTVIGACLSNPDLYPTIDRAGSRRRAPITVGDPNG